MKNTNNIRRSVSRSFAVKCCLLREPEHPFGWGACGGISTAVWAMCCARKTRTWLHGGQWGLWEAGCFLVALPLSPAWTSRREERLKGHLACALGLRDWQGLWRGTHSHWYKGTPGQVPALSERSHLPRKGLLYISSQHYSRVPSLKSWPLEPDHPGFADLVRHGTAEGPGPSGRASVSLHFVIIQLS